MNALENLLIIAGISLDIFAAMECQGSLVAKIDKKQLVKLCALIAAWQMAALFVGSYLSGLLYRNTITHNERSLDGNSYWRLRQLPAFIPC